jgi:succinate dehydrogenase / fumarate reductase membrane anchor subunit
MSAGGAQLRHPMKTARGLGAAKSGLHHWWMQRVTAVALVPLSVWFVWHATWLFSAGFAAAQAFLSDLWNAVFMVAFIVALLYHSYLGLQIVVEDYVAHELKKLTTLVALQFVHLLLAAGAILAVLKVALDGGSLGGLS